MVFLDATVKPIPAFLNLFSSESYNISRFNEKLFHKKIRQVLEETTYDIIQLESLFMAPYLETIRKYSKAKVVLRTHNVEFLIWERLAGTETGILRKWYLNLLARKLKNYETSVLNNFDGVIALTAEDEKLLRISDCRVPLLVSPIGLDAANYQQEPVSQFEPYLFHLGSMDWLPNIEAVDWFLQNVFPELKTRLTGYKVFLAGKNMGDVYLKNADPNLIVSGRVDDSKAFMKGKPIMIVPLLSGGGMRVKIIEGLALGKAIISTSIGAEGIQYSNGKDILIADTPEKFCDAIIKCLSDPGFCKSLGANARVLFEEVYENGVIGNKVIRFYSDLNAPVNSERNNEFVQNH
jgi:glycosyltransferase involved in cell wall biosynthesis